MKKFFSLFAAVLFASSMMAGVVTITPASITDEDERQGSFDKTIEGINLVWEGAYYNGGTKAENNDLRIYASKSMTISCATENIVKIEIAGKTKKDQAITVNKGTVTTGASYASETTKSDIDDPLIVISSINSSSVTITCVKQLQCRTIRVTTGEGGEGGGSGEGGEGEGGGSGEGGETINLNVQYCEAMWVADEDNGDFWQFNLYNDWSQSAGLTYPDMYIVAEPKGETTIAGTYSEDDLYFVQVFTSDNDSAEAVTLSDLKVTCVGEGLYHFEMTFVGDDDNTYVLDAEVETIAYDYETDADIELTDEVTQGIEDIVLTEKAQKVSVDGAVYVIRDNKMYNVTGTRVR